VTLIYLDTADWAYLEAGRAPAEEAALRDLGRTGVQFVVSFDHIVELAGLESGLISRFEFLRTFPGTLLYKCSGEQLIALYARSFTAQVLGFDIQPQEFLATPMNMLSVADLRVMMPRLRVLRAAQRMYATLISGAAPIGLRQNKKERDQKAKIRRLARSGSSPEELHEYLRDKSLLKPGMRAVAQRFAASVLCSVAQWGIAHGIASMAPAPDEEFEKIIGVGLTRKIRSSTDAMKALHAAWSDTGSLISKSPGLACIAGIRRELAPTKDVQKISSTEIDIRHVAFAPQVDVFTCDKRIHRVAAEVIAKAELNVSVLRTGHLKEVAVAAEHAFKLGIGL
jgi:hypothetical protein